NEFVDCLAGSFPFEETLDQIKTIKEVLVDLDKPNPMDRIVLGDVGFGKTEVALRAAMKVVAGGRQVFFLAPTTILADQHFITARTRLEGLGV
ncbi:MAG: DEAD/DEAH box helicase, partial [Arenicellales bacterium]|nr:DEAD/DEAH box helicase [Arenicellales bacterium]